MALVNKSLLYRAPTGRYEVHELLRQYAEEALGQDPAASEAARDRHCGYYTAALQQWAEDLKGPQQQSALAEMEIEIENARAAWDWAAERAQVEQLDQAVEGLWAFYNESVRWQDGEAACRMAAESLATTASAAGLRVWAKVLTRQGDFNVLLGHGKIAHQLLQQNLALLERVELADQDTRAERASALLTMGRTMMRNYDREEAYRLYKQSLTLYQVLSDPHGTARALSSLGGLAYNSGYYDKAKQKFRESLAIWESLGNRQRVAGALSTATRKFAPILSD